MSAINNKAITYQDVCDFIMRYFPMQIEPYSAILHSLLYDVSISFFT
ncbi:hypothetical protein SAMN04488542_10581 [Fontibacillus panacisegetis]|uniref:Uncharacterized protein n=1 Tax=Fontibacillus panacisegetis TaxID=670482 RepID=A0A1G7HY93_9BACL|nr:hypothetical protein SAMN04488542_10581 [Fontibacillus panacisegetis]